MRVQKSESFGSSSKKDHFWSPKIFKSHIFVNYPHKLKVRIIKKSKKRHFSRKYILQNTLEQVNLTEIDKNGQISELCEFSRNSKKGPNCAGPNCASQLYFRR